ncbi:MULTISPECIES: hypothetical protein [unclassified Mesorhizobium]|uniref:hypothetical protein n=1 Tax=unclassified Mesorhizobium TaxID=325217 RepID=UPI0016732DDD|nr:MULTISPECIES: hypothetical protein [unclassified Mesorhizobium]
MTKNDSNPALEEYVRLLVEKTGITEAQAVELIYLLGLNWSSLVREAKAIKKDR